MTDSIINTKLRIQVQVPYHLVYTYLERKVNNQFVDSEVGLRLYLRLLNIIPAGWAVQPVSMHIQDIIREQLDDKQAVACQ